MSATLVWGAMILWTLLGAYIAERARRGLGTGVSEYFIGGRRLRGFVSGMTYAATTYSAFMLVGLVGLTYRSGVGALGFEMTYLVFTVVLLVVFGPRFWLVGRRYDFITPPELLADRYGNRWIATVAAIISFVMLIPYSSVQLIGAGLLVNGLTGGEVPYMAGVLVMAALSGFSAIWAGMRSVAWTDAFQAITMIVTSLIAVLFVMFGSFGSPGDFFAAVERNNPDLLLFDWDPKLFVGITLPWAFFALTNPQVSQRMYVPDEKRSLRRMIVYFSIFGVIYTVISTLFGFQARELLPGLENPDNAMPRLLSTLPTFLSLIIFVGIFSAATSTLGSIILTLSSLFSRDVLTRIKRDADERTQRVAGQFAIVVLLLGCIVFAYFRPGLITIISSMASGGLLVMVPTIIGAFFWRRATAPAALISMIVGGVVTGVMSVSNIYPLGWWPSVWGILLTSLL
ncbi:MAG: sodium:solute symporter family protein, partial [Spirochaetaceae bacterium]